MPWLVLALLSVLSYSFSTILQKVLMKDEQSDPHVYSIVFQVLGAVVVGIFAFTKGFVMPPFTTYPVNFLFLTVLYGTGTLCIFSALKYIEASEATIIGSTRSVVAIVSSVLLLGEVFDFNKGLGTVLILISVILVSEKVGRFKFNRGLAFVIGWVLCYGLAATNDGFLLKHVDVYSYTTIGFLFPGLFLIAVKPKALLRLKPFLQPKIFLKMLVLIVFYAMGAILFYSAIEKGANISQISPMSQSVVILTVFLAAVFLKERDHLLKKIISAVLVTIGVLLLK